MAIYPFQVGREESFALTKCLDMRVYAFNVTEVSQRLCRWPFGCGDVSCGGRVACVWIVALRGRHGVAQEAVVNIEIPLAADIDILILFFLIGEKI